MTYELQTTCSHSQTCDEPISAVLSQAEFGLPMGTVFVGFTAAELEQVAQEYRLPTPQWPPTTDADPSKVSTGERIVGYLVVVTIVVTIVALCLWWARVM